VEITEYFGSDYELNIPETIDGKTVTSIGEAAFIFCDKLTNVTIPNSVVNIGGSAFSGCERLASIAIPDSVVTIGESAFSACERLKTVTIGSGVAKIAEDAFFGCEKLISIDVDSNNANYSSENGVLYNKNKTMLMQYPCGKTDTSFTIPDSVTSIAEGAFAFSTSLKNVTIPNSVTSIGEGAFAGCGLTSIAIPNSVTTIGEAAFIMCENLTSINVDSANKMYASADGVLYNKNKTELLQYPSGKTSTSFTIPSSVKTIAEGSFFFCEKLRSVTLPKSVTSISDAAFFFCESLTTVTVYNYSVKIGEMAFPFAAVIKGYKGSTAEKYAKANDNKFVALKCTHKYKTTTVKATTKTNGKITKKCSVCGETTKTTLYTPKTVTFSATVYNGKAQKPTVTVKDSKGKKIAASNYTVKYSNNKNVGKATATITFKGNYSGTLKKTFTIKPKATTLSSVKAGKKKFTAKWKKQATQTTGYELQYSTNKNFKKGNKTITVGKNTTSKTVSKLTAKKNYYVRVRTYKTVKVNGKSTKIYSAWSKSKVVTTKK
ncbi:MAG: leucine-rich repeat protein, partial [Eubacterium sp.]|nr:leucine-rich repeat protein [Eubacterium sp.]